MQTEQEPRTKVTTTRLRPRVRRLVEGAARVEGRTISSWLARVAERHARKQLAEAAEPERAETVPSLAEAVRHRPDLT